MNRNHKIRTPVWVPPWGYAEGWLISIGLLAVGLLLQVFGGGLNPNALSWPVNMYIALIFNGLLISAYLCAGNTPLVSWLGRVPAAICSITLVTLLVLVMGLILQDDDSALPWIRRIGFSSMTNSWPFLLSMMYFMAALGMATVKRIFPYRKKNLCFILNHLGLYIVVTGGLLGSADIDRRLMELRQGEIIWLASDDDGHVHEMPLAMELIRFEKEEYHPKAALIETDTHRIAAGTDLDIFEIDTAVSGNLGNWKIDVINFHSLSIPVDDRYEPVLDIGAGPAAFVRVTRAGFDENITGWITCGSFAFPHQLLELDDNHSLAMTVPRASAYRSQVMLYTPDDKPMIVTIEVNKPYSASGWKLYQYSYDDRFGRWSRTSIIEAIRDPWLPVVYTGVFMMLAGALYLMFKGKTRVNNVGYGKSGSMGPEMSNPAKLQNVKSIQE